MNPICIKLIQAMFILCLVLHVEFICAKEVPRCIQREREALVDFKAGLVDHNGMLSSWSMTADCCQWKGIRCSNLTGHVLMVDLHGYLFRYTYITGIIHKSLMELQQLQYLNLSGNMFKDNNIPNFFGSLGNLRYLDLSDSMFGGKIPSQIGSLSHLKHLDLSFNHLEGSIPYQLGNLSNLQFLNLERNLLKGNVPSQLGRLSKLEVLYLGGNDGALKIEDRNYSRGKWLSNLTALTYLNLREMSHLSNSNGWLQMIGKLPRITELNLRYCGLSDHFILSSSISKFNFSTSLSILDLSLNRFKSSMVFQWVSNLSSNLVELDLSLNFREATLPNHFSTEMIGKLPKLKKLRLSGCNLSDDFLVLQPSFKFNFSTSLSVLDLSGNSFKSSMVFQWVSNISFNLIELDLSFNLLESPTSNESGIVMNSLERLYLFDNRLRGGVFKSFMNICTLRELFMFKNNLTEDLPSIIHDLSCGCVRNSLQGLYLDSNKITGSLPADLSMFSSLNQLDISENRLSGKIIEGIILPPRLEYLVLSSNSFEGGIPKSFGNACTLILLDMSDNNLSEEITIILKHLSGCVTYSLKGLYLSNNQLHGQIPEGIKLPSQLATFSVGTNNLEGGIPKSFGNACTLSSLDISNNSLTEELPVIIHHLSGCARYSLEGLYLSMNQINATLPDLSMFSSLKTLDLSENKLNGTLTEDIRFPPQLEEMDMKANFLNGVISDSHFANMSKLQLLDLSDNSLALTFSQNWIPPFQMLKLRLRSCILGPQFPKWLKTQDSFKTLDISNAGISDTVPKWFWDILALQDGKTINISYNNLKGVIPNYPLKDTYSYLYLASNRFEGRIPPFLRGALILDLSKNQFSDSVSFLCTIGAVKILYQLDLSNNLLYGKIPNCWIRFKALAYLDLSHNKFSGNIPTSFGSLVNVQALLLRSNNLTDDIHFSLMNCTKLVMLDAGENRLSGLVPAWIGSKLKKLQILSLGKNRFFGNLPLELCFLKKIQLLDLSLNKLSGRIPKCFRNFTSMTQKTSSRGYEYFINTSRIYSSRSYDLNAFLMWKGVEQRFKNNGLLLLKSIDLSSNQFSDEIPTELIDNLLELVSLNLSRNNLTGKIPSNIGKLASLEFLDLSRNQLTGSIPSSIVQIDRLAMLDLSHNHLSGRIPTSTQLQSFNVSSYEDNLDLCGLPVEKLCIDKGEPMENIQEDENLFLTRGFYMSMAIGFFIGFWGIFGSILLNRSWRHAYFEFLNKLTDNIYVMIVVKYKRWLND